MKKTAPDELANMIDRLIKAIVMTFNKEQSEQIRVFDVLGYSSPQIAGLLRTTSENVRQTLHRLKMRKSKKRSQRTKVEATP